MNKENEKRDAAKLLIFFVLRISRIVSQSIMIFLECKVRAWF